MPRARLAGASYPDVTIGGDGQPIVAWEDTSRGPTEIYVARYDGGAWVEVSPGSARGGGISNSSANSLRPVARYVAGRLCVAWSDRDLNRQVLVRCLDL